MSTLTLLFLLFLQPALHSQTQQEKRTIIHFDSIRTNPLLLASFLRRMPKGGDLHNHLSGAIYAETYIAWLADADGCIDTASMVSGRCDGSAGEVKAKDVLNDPTIYRAVVDAWSMRNYELSGQSGHDHFFDTFGKFGGAGSGRDAEMLAEAKRNAARDGLQYLELMRTLDAGRSLRLAARLGWKSDFAAMRKNLLDNGLRDSLKAAMSDLTRVEARADSLLGCAKGTGDSIDQIACRIEHRYLFQVLRGLDPAFVFAQILTGFELAEMDGRMVGFNLVMPEDYPVPLRDFELQMQMIDYLRPLYPHAHISLHAGELAPGLVTPEELCCHIRQSIELGHAERIGHGVDIAYENNAEELLRLMSAKKVMVEVCLTSNDVILGITGDHHPLPLYRTFNVPTALATDDEGVSRIDLTSEHVRAVLEHRLTYLDLKQMARTSLEHAFVEGSSLWRNGQLGTMVDSCRGDLLNARLHSPSCDTYLKNNEKARLQWQLEVALDAFEKGF